MALLWFDGFESYGDWADMALTGKYSSGLGIYSNAAGRNGRCVLSQIGRFFVAIPENPQTIIFGDAIYLGNFDIPVSGATWYRQLFGFQPWYSTTAYNLTFRVNASRNIEVRQGLSGTLIGTTSGVTLLGQVWYYIQIKATISDTVGQVTIRINGVEVLNTSADKDTCHNGTYAYTRCVQIGHCYAIDTYHDDLYICDDTGDAPYNDFLGDIRIDPLRPNAAGTYTDFTPSAGDNDENVDETYPDDDSTYNDGTNVADQDSYALESLPSPASTTIYGVKSQITVRKTDAGAKECKLLTRVGTTDDLGDTINLSDTFTTHYKIFEDNPDDSAAFEDADVNGMEVGVEITA